MTSRRRSQRGEGKLGCIISLLVMAILVAVGIKVLPVLFADNSLFSTAEDLGSRAGLMSSAAIEQQLRAKAAELEIPEALPKGAMTITVMGDKQSGTCVIRLNFTRKIDFYGFYTYPLEIDRTFNRPFMDVR